MDISKLEKFTVSALRDECKSLGLPSTGIKRDLVDRVTRHLKQKQSQSVVESTPTKPVKHVQPVVVEKTVEKTPGDNVQPRSARPNAPRRTPKKLPASFFADPPVRLFAVAVEIEVRPKSSRDTSNLTNGNVVEISESTPPVNEEIIEEVSTPEEEQPEPEQITTEPTTEPLQQRGGPPRYRASGRERERGPGRGRGRGSRTPRGRRTNRTASQSRESETREEEPVTVVEEHREPIPVVETPKTPVRASRSKAAQPPATPAAPEKQTIPTPPQEDNDVEMEDTSMVEATKGDTLETRPQTAQPQSQEETTTGFATQIAKKEPEKTATATIPPTLTNGIPGLTATADASDFPKQPELSRSNQVAGTQQPVTVGAVGGQGDVEMRDVVEPAPAPATGGPQEVAPSTGAAVAGPDQQLVNGQANGYNGYYNAQTGYDHQAYVEYYRERGFDYEAWYQQQAAQWHQQQALGNQVADPYYQPIQAQPEAQPAAPAQPTSPIDYTQVPAPLNLPATHTAPVQPEEVPDARKRKRGDTPLLAPIVDGSGNKKQKQDEPVQPETTEVQHEQQAQDSQEAQPQDQTTTSVQEPGPEQEGKTDGVNGLLSPEKARGRLSFTLSARKTARPVNEDESLADIEPQENEAAWNGFSTDRPIDTTTPSLHPPTRALYIDNLMRPLKEYNLRDHLASLAEPDTYQSLLSRTPADPVENCYLDPLKSHAFASFKTIEQAIRVRSQLHTRVWPEERTRKPLQIDYFPEQLFSEWVVKERQSSSDGRVFKWRVVYKSGDAPNSVRAVLEEMGESTYQPFNKDFKHDNRYGNRRDSGGYHPVGNTSYHGYNKYTKNNSGRYYSQDTTAMQTSPNFIPTGPRKSFDGNRRNSGFNDHDRPRKVYEEPVHIGDEKYYDDDFHGDDKDTSLHTGDSNYYKSTPNDRSSSSRRRNRHRRISSRDYSSKEYRDYSPPPRDRTRTRSPTPDRPRERSLSKSVDGRSPDRDRERSRERSMERSRERTRERSRTRSLERSRERSRGRDDDDRSRMDASEPLVDAGPSKSLERDRDSEIDIDVDRHRHEDVDVREGNGRKIKIMNMDELFMFTEAKPKLYYLPVSEEVARERLKHREDMHKNARRYWRKKKQQW